MKPIVKFHKYSLSFVNPPNAKTPSSTIKGALIMINGGYGCIQPWPTLGDKNLEYHLDSILSDTPSEIAQAAIKCCMIDSEARKKKFNLMIRLSAFPSVVLTVVSFNKVRQWIFVIFFPG